MFVPEMDKEVRDFFESSKFSNGFSDDMYVLVKEIKELRERLEQTEGTIQAIGEKVIGMQLDKL